jgi:hypothetical protein
MTVHTLSQPYQTATEKAHIGRWLNQTVGLRLDKATSGEKGTTSIAVTVFTADDLETGEPARLESARIIGQLAGFEIGSVVVCHVVPLGKRGQVLAPPEEGDKDAAAIAKALG